MFFLLVILCHRFVESVYNRFMLALSVFKWVVSVILELVLRNFDSFRPYLPSFFCQHFFDLISISVAKVTRAFTRVQIAHIRTSAGFARCDAHILFAHLHLSNFSPHCFTYPHFLIILLTTRSLTSAAIPLLLAVVPVIMPSRNSLIARRSPNACMFPLT
jgi:hypothetical protein